MRDGRGERQNSGIRSVRVERFGFVCGERVFFVVVVLTQELEVLLERCGIMWGNLMEMQGG